MKLNYKLEMPDYMYQKIYEASQSVRIKKSRRRTNIFIGLVFGIMMIYFMATANISLAAGVALGALLYFFLFQRQYKNRYARYAHKQLSENMGKHPSHVVELRFLGNKLLMAKGEHQNELPYKNLELITEIPKYVFIRPATGDPIIIPTNKLDNPQQFKTFLKSLAAQNHINYTEDPSWSWH